MNLLFFAHGRKRRAIAPAALLVFASVLILSARLRAAEPEPFALKSGKHLFIDGFLLDEIKGARLTVNPPERRELVMIADQPWEKGGITSYGNFFFDPYAGEYKMYYVPINLDVNPIFSTCLATSQDGIHWEKPMLGVHEWNGSTANNIVVPEQREGTVFIDPNAPPEHRYAFISCNAKLRMTLYTSPDGIHFTERKRVSDYWSDSQVASFWDEDLKKYVHYPRAHLEDGQRDAPRGVGRVATDKVDQEWPITATGDRGLESPDMQAVMSGDENDPISLDLYTNAAVKYPGASNVYLAFPTPYYHWNWPARKYLNDENTLKIGGKSNDGTIETQLAVSRDGISWDRLRVPYVPVYYHEDLYLRVVMMYQGLIIRERTIDQYFAGYNFTHGDTEIRKRHGGQRHLGGVFRVVQRLDGFVSLDFDYTGGTVTTQPFTFTGKHLKLNLTTSASGEGRVAILNEAGEPIPEFSLDASRYINGDFVDYTAQWNASDGNSTADVSALAGKPIRLRFDMRGTKLFSFWFTEE